MKKELFCSKKDKYPKNVILTFMAWLDSKKLLMEKKTTYFYTEGEAIVAIDSASKNISSDFNWICEEDTTLVIGKLDRIKEAFTKNPKLDKISGIFISKEFGKYQNLSSSLITLSRKIIRERTMVGLETAKARGRKGGRPAGLTKEALTTAKIFYESCERTIKESSNNSFNC